MSSRRPASTAEAAPPAQAARRNWLRALALALGVIVFIAHVITIRPAGPHPRWFEIYWPDLYKHIVIVAAFALSYRLSYTGAAGSRHRSRSSRVTAGAADTATVLVCSSWGAFCEILQHWIPARDFSVIELSANVLTPIIVVGLLRWLSGWRSWFA